MADAPQFLFATCQVGVEWALKDEVARRWPQLHFAFSRPGFVTFKLIADTPLPAANPLTGSVFARTCGRSLGKIEAECDVERIEGVWQLIAKQPFDHLHMWQRDNVLPGDHGFSPGPSATANGLGRRLLDACPSAENPPLNELAHPGETVLDCVIVEPNAWWIGLHCVDSVPQRWPAGVPLLTAPDDMISRAYLKMGEALAWSRMPVQPGDPFVEIGCAPGGAGQTLVDRGFAVTGIDPAEVDERLRNRKGFTHIRKRGADLRRIEYRAFRWLAADLNVAPGYTLETVENIVTYQGMNIMGLLLTLKLSDRALYAQIGNYLSRIRSWGYEDVRARQLAFNRHEICVAALRNKSLRRGKK